MIKKVHNPDVLTCIANLSSDEVFTPPPVVNQMLDSLPKELWSNEKTTFLDPVSKSGVFLREITKRLIDGLESKIPNLENRIEHILHNQVFGIGITELTSLISRRSLYCSKYANGKYSIVQFDDEQGNLKYFEAKHKWSGNNCIYCGVNKKIYQRESELESYAYSFIHTENPEKLFNMKFDVIIGNPPYQMNDGGGMGASALPIYQKFVENAVKMRPRYLSMIIPSRWFAGGRGLDEFREKMIQDKRLEQIHDYVNASDCFPGVEIKGGVNYFLWNKEYDGDCEIFTYENNQLISKMKRPLLLEGSNVFVRYNESINILQKIRSFSEDGFSRLVSSNDPFGFDVREKGSYKRIKPNYKLKPFSDSVRFYYNNWSNEGIGYISKKDVRKNSEWVNEIKVLIPKAVGTGNPKDDEFKPFIVESGSCCSETYLVIGPCPSYKYAENLCSYIRTKFFHFLVTLVKNTQGAYKPVYQFVPLQNFGENWSDEKLYKKYNLNEDEIDFIENMIRPME